MFLARPAYLRDFDTAGYAMSSALDFSHAYKNEPIPESQLEFATIIIAGPNGAPQTATLRSHPYGSRRAPANWARVAQFPKWAISAIFSIPIDVRVGDFHWSGQTSNCESALRTAKALCVLRGLALDPRKDPPTVLIDELTWCAFRPIVITRKLTCRMASVTCWSLI